MAALVREACVLALKESMRTAAAAEAAFKSAAAGSSDSNQGNHSHSAQPTSTGMGPDKPCVCARHFEDALGRVAPSVSRKDQRCYDALRSRLRSSRGRCVSVFVHLCSISESREC